MPILPAVPAVADAQFVLYTLFVHLEVDIDGKLKQVVVVAAVKEPLDSAQFGNGFLVSIVNKIKS